MMYPLSILIYAAPNTGISVANTADITSILIHSDSVQIDNGYDEEADDLIWIDASNKMYDKKFFLDLIFYYDNEIYSLKE